VTQAKPNKKQKMLGWLYLKAEAGHSDTCLEYQLLERQRQQDGSTSLAWSKGQNLSEE
jgi:hypothetical protein